MNIVSIDGGGYLGLATAEFVAGIEAHFGITFHEQFELFCGTSTGALISLALATGRTGDDVTKLYKLLGKDIFTPRTDIPWWCQLKPGFFSESYRDRRRAVSVSQATAAWA